MMNKAASAHTLSEYYSNYNLLYAHYQVPTLIIVSQHRRLIELFIRSLQNTRVKLYFWLFLQFFVQSKHNILFGLRSFGFGFSSKAVGVFFLVFFLMCITLNQPSVWTWPRYSGDAQWYLKIIHLRPDLGTLKATQCTSSDRLIFKTKSFAFMMISKIK